MQPIIISHEHPDWFKPLFELFDKQGIAFKSVNPTQHQYAIDAPKPDFNVFFNRMSPSAYLRDGVQGTFYTQYYLKHLELHGVRVINGYQAYVYETSKALQLSLLQSLGIKYPKSKVVNHVSKIKEALAGLRFPIVIKANIGGSGAGIEKFNSLEEVETAIANNAVDFGIDHTALVQEFIPARGGYISRVETIGGKVIYGIRVHLTGDTFNLCPADICQTNTGEELVRNACAVDAPKNGLKVESFVPSDEVVQTIETIMAHTGIDVGGIEFIIDDRDGEIYYYDINALSNFVADAVNVIGFNPHDLLVDFLVREQLKQEQLTVEKTSVAL